MCVNADKIIIYLYRGFLYITNKVDGVGFEPTTNALKGHCSTIELPVREKVYIPPFLYKTFNL